MKRTEQRPGEPLAKRCTRCGEDVWIVLFRVLTTGNRQSWCEDCERDYDRERRGTSVRLES